MVKNRQSRETQRITSSMEKKSTKCCIFGIRPFSASTTFYSKENETTTCNNSEKINVES